MPDTMEDMVARMRDSKKAGVALAVSIGAILAMTGCVPEPEATTATPMASSTTAPRVTPTPTPSPSDPFEALSLEQRVGQVFMVGTPVEQISAITAAAVTEQQVGGIFLHGRTKAGVGPTAELVAELTAGVTGISPWVATDQEGGTVQVLRGPGFDEIPSAVDQGVLPTQTLRADAERWAFQLRQAGVDMNLAPVADIVTSTDTAPHNPPIGALGRQYGYDEQSVTLGVGAFAEGMRAAGVMPTLKHFPGLGRTTANTDYSSRVVDNEVGVDSADVAVYRSVLAQGPAIVMMSTAYYEQIDPTMPAAFSDVVIGGLLRESLGFDGVVMTDDVSAAAAAEVWEPAERAILALEAGVDLVLVSADPTVFPEMYDAVLAKAQTDPAFAEKVDAAAQRVVHAKASFGAEDGE